MYVQRKIQARSRNHLYRGKAISIIIMSVFVARVIDHGECMCRVILPSVACLALPYFSAYHDRHDFRGGITEHKMF
jgi:hypothetical protein